MAGRRAGGRARAEREVAFDWIDTDEGVVSVAGQLADEPSYALDTEFHRERTYWPRPALLQLSWPGRTVLIDPQATDPAPLAAVLRGPGLAVLHAAEQDLEVLDRWLGAAPSRLFDTQLAAGFLGFSSPSLVTLVERLLGIRLAKGDRLTDWTRRPLTAAQCRYAASDVVHLLELRRVLARKLSALGRLAWAEEECAGLLARPRTPQDPDTAWWRIKEARSLRGEGRAVAQTVGGWRERRAAAIDRPTRMVLPDLAVLGIAHRLPSSPAELREIRGIDGRHLGEANVAGILEAVAAGRSLPPAALRLPPTEEFDRRLRPAVTLASAWIAQLAQDVRIDATLLATRADLLAFVRGDETARLAQGWRAEAVGERVSQLLEGDAALAFRPERGDLVLERRSREELPVGIALPTEEELPGPGRPSSAAVEIDGDAERA